MQGEGTGVKKIGGRKVIHSQSREVVIRVYSFMKKEADSGKTINVDRIQTRVSEATGVSVSTLKRILKEHEHNKRVGKEFSTPHKKRPRRKIKTDIDEFDKCVIRRTINEFHTTENERPTLQSLLSVLKKRINFSGGKWALWKIIRDLGFRWRKSENNRKILIEKDDIRAARLAYLRNISRYRREGRPIIYTDETYIHSSHTKDHAWSDGTNAGLLAPVSKGQRVIIVHAGSENGFISNALLMFKSGTKSGDYHHEMNFDNYERWLKTKLMPNLPPNSVLVVDNAPYHNAQLNPAPTSSSRKSAMIDWLSERGIPFSDRMCKPELYSLIKLRKPQFKTFKIDALLAEHGHSVLRLPPYHPDLNPIELIWASVKEYVARKNVSFRLDDAMKLAEEKLSLITKEEWSSRCNNAHQCEQNYLRLEPFIDDISEQIVVNLQGGSEISSCSSSEEEEMEEKVAEEDDGELSGLEAL